MSSLGEVAAEMSRSFAVEHREAPLVSNVVELLRTADELGLSVAGHDEERDSTLPGGCALPTSLVRGHAIRVPAARGSPTEDAPEGAARQPLEEEVLQQRLRTARSLAEAQAWLGGRVERRHAQVIDERQQLTAAKERVRCAADESRSFTTRLAQYYAQLADVEQRCVQEADEHEALLDAMQVKVDECSLALLEVGELRAQQSVALREAAQTLTAFECQAERLRQEALLLGARRQEIELREVALRCMEGAQARVVAQCRQVRSENSDLAGVCDVVAQHIAAELLRSQPYLQRVSAMVRARSSTSAVCAASTGESCIDSVVTNMSGADTQRPSLLLRERHATLERDFRFGEDGRG